MKKFLFLTLASILSCAASAHGELPDFIKPTAEEFERNMKTFGDNLAIVLKSERDGYTRVLEAAQKQEAGANRPAAVAAIAVEIKALQTGSLAETPPKDFPDHVKIYRDRYIRSKAQAEKNTSLARRSAQDGYAKWLTGVAEAARRGKGKELEEAAVAEEKRVRAMMEKEAGASTQKPSSEKSPQAKP